MLYFPYIFVSWVSLISPFFLWAFPLAAVLFYVKWWALICNVRRRLLSVSGAGHGNLVSTFRIALAFVAWLFCLFCFVSFWLVLVSLTACKNQLGLFLFFFFQPDFSASNTSFEHRSLPPFAGPLGLVASALFRLPLRCPCCPSCSPAALLPLALPLGSPLWRKVAAACLPAAPEAGEGQEALITKGKVTLPALCQKCFPHPAASSQERRGASRGVALAAKAATCGGQAVVGRRVPRCRAAHRGLVWSYLSQSSGEGQPCSQKVMWLSCWLVCHFQQLLSDIIMTNPVLTAWNRLQEPCDDYLRHHWV